ncbi:MAG: hypothetical protein HPY58_04595 [Firmicutes bacterium]|nr:hypothetical protein [Bacillota bacterium]
MKHEVSAGAIPGLGSGEMSFPGEKGANPVEDGWFFGVYIHHYKLRRSFL